jgi:hypothetical protein
MTEIGIGQGENLAEQRRRLASLESCEARIRTLRDQECDLEVEHIAADAALQSATKRLQPSIDTALALQIGQTMEGRHDGNEEQGVRSTGSARDVDRLRAGCAALQSWLDASKPQAPGATARAAKVTLLIATLATLWAAYAIHPAFLLLLAVVVGPVSFAMGRGHDSQWQQVGARRRYGASGLADLAAWDEATVCARMLELQSLLAETDGEPLREYPPDTQAEADMQLASDLKAAGLTMEDTEGEMGKWLRLVARAHRSRESLERVKSERTRLRREAAEHRDQLLRYLQSLGDRPTQQPDTAAAIGERLDRLSQSS